MKVFIVGAGSDLEITKKLTEHLSNENIPFAFLENDNSYTTPKPSFIIKEPKKVEELPKKGSKYHK